MSASSESKYRHTIGKWNAKLWNRIYQARYLVTNLKQKIGSPAFYSILIVISFSTFIYSPELQEITAPNFSTPDGFSGLQSFFATLGGALIGAAAIAFSLIMFAMQVNVERMPHGLFRKFSSDWKLLGAFAGSFALRSPATC